MTNRKNASLWKQIEEFELDVKGDALSFSQRLGRDNDWSLSFARRVIDEYKKFVYLTMTADHVVTPSEEVDEAWHLHLLYTQSYWNEFCGKILGKPLHHSPTRGGPTELLKHRKQYELTIASYVESFGEPPRDIWPEAEKLFPIEPRSTSMIVASVSRIWNSKYSPIGAVIGLVKRGIKKLRQPIVLLIGVICATIVSPQVAMAKAAADAERTWNIFTWRGPDYLQFHIPLLIVFLIMAFGYRTYRYMNSATLDRLTSDELDINEAAFLAGGNKRLFHSAMMVLIARGELKFDSVTKSFVAVEALGEGASPTERAIYTAVLKDGKIKSIWNAIEPDRLAIYEELQNKSLIVSDEDAKVTQRISGFIVLVPILFGITKAIVGLSLGRPIGFLAVLVIANGLAAVCFFLKKPFRTPRGNAVLQATKERHEQSRATPLKAGVDPIMIGMLLGLYGSTVLAGSPWESTQKELHGEMSGAGYTGSGCSSCGGGGGGCGGGGCGGGCGGCGGGD